MTVHSDTNHVDASSVLSLVTAAGAVMTFGFPAIGILLAVAAVAFAAVSRRRLQRNRMLRGSRLSLIGFLVGLAVLLVEVIPVLINYALVLVAAIAHR